MVVNIVKVSAVLVAITFALCGCGNTSSSSSPTTTPTSTSPSTSASATPQPSASTPPQEETVAGWTNQQLYDACVSLRSDMVDGEEATEASFTPGPLSGLIVHLQTNGALEVVVNGTSESSAGETFVSSFVCEISGTPDAPIVSEYAGP